MQAVDAAKRVMNKEKTDGQMIGQASAPPFMTIKGSQTNTRCYSPHNHHSQHNHRQVTFHRNKLNQKIDKLSHMMSKMATSILSSPSSKP